MRTRPSPAHAREEPPVLLSEDVLASTQWRDRTDPGAGGTGSAGVAGAAGMAGAAGVAERASTLERVAVLPMRARITRAVRAPVVAGAVVFIVAVLAAIGVAVVTSLGGELPIGGGSNELQEAGTGLMEAADQGAVERAGAGEAGSSSDEAGETLFVHVVGAVERSGVVTLEAGARVSDAIEAAGGASDTAVLAGVNLARLVTDGEQLVVPDEEALAAGGAAGVENAGGTNPAGAESPLVNLNTADAEALETLPRVGPALAGRIIDWREMNGGFASVDQLLEVPGIGAKTLAGFRDRVTV